MNLDTILTYMRAQVREDQNIPCAQVPLRVMLASLGLAAMPGGAAMLRGAQLMHALRPRLACSLARWNRA